MSAEPKERGVLRCHCLAFHKVSKDKSGKCDIVSSKESDVVWGRLYHIDDKEKELLDRHEGLGSGYDKKFVTVELDCGTHGLCHDLLIEDDTKKNPSLKPYTWYKKHVLVGAKESCLPPDYIKKIEEVKARKDCDKKREAQRTCDILLENSPFDALPVCPSHGRFYRPQSASGRVLLM